MTSCSWQPVGAVTLVALTGLLLLLGRPAPPAAPEPPVPAATTRVVGRAASFAATGRWSAQQPGALLYYVDTAGVPVVGLVDAVVADAGSCTGRPASNRGFAGLAAPETGDVVSLHAAALARWTTGISGRPRSGPSRPLVLVDGTTGLRTVVRLRPPADDDPCTAAQVVLDLVSLVSGAGVTTFVVARDLDPRGVDEAEVEAMVQSLRSRT